MFCSPEIIKCPAPEAHNHDVYYTLPKMRIQWINKMAYIYCNKEQRDIISGIKRKMLKEKWENKDDSKVTDADVMEFILKEAEILLN